MNWKALTSSVCNAHNDQGISLLSKAGEDLFDSGHTVVNTTPETDMLRVPGKELHPKPLRRYLWENRKDRRVSRDRAALWTLYDHTEDVSVFGVGAITSTRTAERCGEGQVLSGGL